MAMTVTVDADDLAYLAELAAKHLVQIRGPADHAAVGPIFRAFVTLEKQAPRTFAHQYDLWAVVDGVEGEGGVW